MDICHFSTGSLPAGGRITLWQQLVARHLVGLSQIDMEREDFSGSCSVAAAAGMRVAEIASTGHVVERSRGERERHPKDSIFLSLMLEGTGFLHQGQSSVLLAPQDMVIYNPSRPYLHGFNTGMRQITFDIPRTEFTRRFGNLDFPDAMLVSGALPAGASASRRLARRAALLHSPGQGDAELWDSLSEIIDTVLPDRKGVGSTRSDMMRIEQICEDRLHDSDFDLAELCEAADMTARRVQRRFEASGTSFRLWLRMRRLERAAKMLVDPKLSHATITAIAFATCFSDSAHFSRCFREAYGTSPREWRSCRTRPPIAARPADGSD